MPKLEFETKDKTKDSIVTPLGLESCWGFPVSHACRTEPFADRLWHIFARFCFAFSGFEDAASAPSLRTNYLPLGLESCWGFPVSHACRTEPFADRLWHIFARFCFAFSGFEDAASAPSLRTNYLPLGLESCWGFPVSHACRTEPFADRLWHIFARFCFAFSGFEDAASAPSLRTNYLPLGLESCCWGFPVSHARRTEPFADRLWHIFARFCFAFSGFEDAASAPSPRTNYLPLGLESCWGFPVSHACRTEPFADRLWHIFARFCFAFSCTRSVESSVSNVGQADPRQAQGCIKGSLPTSRQIQHSRAWTGRRPKKMVVSWYLFVVQWWFYLFIGVCTTILLVFPWDSRNKQFSWLLSCTLLDGLAKTYIKSKNT